MKTVYLAGPIAGLKYGEATDWREGLVSRFESIGIKALSPMRAKSYLKEVTDLTGDFGQYSCLSSNRGIIARDRWDATRCDVLLVNLLCARKISIGTVMEVAWADLRRTPIVCAIEPTGNPHEHGMLMEAVGFRVPTLEEAVEVVAALLT